MENTELVKNEEVVETKKAYNPADYERATLEDYGYKDHKALKMTWKITSIVLLILSIIMLYLAIIYIAIQSFNSGELANTFESFTFDNYLNMFSKRDFNNAVRNTFLTSIFATIIATILGTLIGIGAFYLPPKAKKRLSFLNNIPLLNADIVTGISLMLIMMIFRIFFPHFFGFWTILIAHLYFILPYIILSVLPKMKEIDSNMLEASLDLGVKPFKSLRKVLIPAVKGGIFTGMLLAFTISFEDFVVGYFTTGNGYNTLSIWIYSSIGRKSLFPGVYAFSTLVTVLTILGIVIYNVIKNMKGRGKREKKNS